jgi:3-(methylthio)propionyl---CoA ligase
MLGLMMNTPLLISSLLKHADRNHGDTEIVSRTVEGGIHRYTYSEAHRRACRLANALEALDVREGDRIATLAWNGYRHFEIYYGVSGIGAVCHTINPRLFPEQIVYIANHAEDSYLFTDLTFVPLLEKIAGQLTTVRGIVVMTDRAHMPQTNLPGVLCYEELLAAQSDEFEWPLLDESAAASLCYTSGTTGNPKGVMYSHRSTVLHAYAAALPDALNVSARDCILPVVPMFHANAWGLVYAAPLTGAKVVFPGAALDGASICELVDTESVTHSAGVPTVWLALLNYLKQSGRRLGSMKQTVIGGSACPPAMLRAFEQDYGVRVLHAWGMTEMSPLGTVNTFKAKHGALDPEQRLALQAKQGRTIFGVEMKIVDDHGKPLPHDGVAFGNLMVRGPWICRGYYRGEGGDPLRDGWFPTGDVATIDPDGYMQITDRSKDVIKSGGEWISSIDLENAAVAHPAVAEAAVVGVPHPKWDERPLLLVVKRPGATVTRDEMIRFFDGRVAKWWIPDDVVFVDELPHTATGKLQKNKLRDEYREYRLPTADLGRESKS